MNYVTGKLIKQLREKKGLTQKQLADIINVSDKTISKWETEKGCPDISVTDSLAYALGVSLGELFSGNIKENQNISANLRKSAFYICPVCGNVIHAIGQCNISCCGINLIEEYADLCNIEHNITLEISDNEYYVTVEHPMTKQHYISFISYVTSGSVEIIKLYPEQNAGARFRRKGHGTIYICCNKDGMFKITV